jgi:putative ABC transport system permease protein
MILAIGVGIGSAMTTLTIFRAMSADPIPDKSARLFTPQIDSWGPEKDNEPGGPSTSDRLPAQLSYRDALELMKAHPAERQAAMFAVRLAIHPPNPQLLPFRTQARATYSDFFSMFEIPFKFGAPWNQADDESRAPVVVITRALNERVFAGAKSIGRTLTIGTKDYRVVGVLSDWEPVPRFYDLNGGPYGGVELLFLPFTVATEQNFLNSGAVDCAPESEMESGPGALLRSECVWIQLWAELPTPTDVKKYTAFLTNYALTQKESGRFNWGPRVALRSVRQWLAYRHIVSNDIVIMVPVSCSFLLVCLINAMGLMLASFMARASSFGIRRALGATRSTIFMQCLVEAGVIGVAGALVGLAFLVIGLVESRGLLSTDAFLLTRLHGTDVLICVILAIVATLVAGAYPAWRAVQLQPARQVKVQ